LRYLFFIFLSLPILSWGQADSLVLLTKNFKFEDGVYLSVSELQQNSPSLPWDSLYSILHTNPQNLTTLVDTIEYRSGEPLDSIWGFSLGGIPYVNLNEENNAGLMKYVGLKVRGNICYFSLEEVYEKPETITAYNPRTGIPFRQGVVMIEQVKERQYMMLFESGEVEEFTALNFLEWIEEDEKLVKTVKGLDESDLSEKLFKCLLIYDDRNPVYVPVSNL